jgi:hypothetical protein
MTRRALLLPLLFCAKEDDAYRSRTGQTIS